MNFSIALHWPTRMPAVLVLACLAALAACQPSYNWREIRETDAGYRILLPAKPASMSRPIDLDGMKVTMAMSGARVDETLFTVGAIVLPAAQEGLRTHAMRAMRTAMERNVQGHETKSTQIEVPVIDPAGRTVSTVTGTHVEVEGTVSGKPSHMSATFVARGDRAWQVVMIAPVADPATVKLFHESFRIAP